MNGAHPLRPARQAANLIRRHLGVSDVCLQPVNELGNFVQLEANRRLFVPARSVVVLTSTVSWILGSSHGYDVTADGSTSHQRVTRYHRPSGARRRDAPGSLEPAPVDQWLEELISCGQSLADRVAEFQPHDLIHAIRALLAKIPSALPVTNRLVACSVFCHVMGRVAVLRHIDSKPEVERAFVAFAAARVSSECWHAELFHLYDCCIAALGETRLDSKQTPHHATDARIARALSTIETRHRNPDLMLAEVAQQANLSCCHLARILKRETGVGFVGHVRRARIKDAESLLSDSLLSVKEIASLVGYRGPRQLDRDFKRVCGFTPLSFRRHVFRTRPTGIIDVQRS